MPDVRLRELEKIWKATGSLDAEVAYLRERTRCGLLPDDWLELAAYLGPGISNRRATQPGTTRTSEHPLKQD